jgi:molybdate transport system substrate-binding protein
MTTAPPTAEHPEWGEGWSVGLRLWVERAGQAILGKGRLELLEGIDQHHSISAAARALGMSYRRAWELVQSINAAAGEPLVEAATGGVKGGGAQLTARGRWAVAVFRELQEQVLQTGTRLLPRLVERSPASGLHVVAAVSLEEVVEQLLTDFAEQEPALRVRAVFGASDELVEHILGGAPADLFLTADARQFERLQATGLVCPEEQLTFAANGLAAIGTSGRKLAVHKVADLARASAPRLALAEPNCPLGYYTRAYLEERHLYEPLRARALRVENSRAVVTAVRAGQADVGLVYASDAAREDGYRVLFRPRRLPVPIRYSGAVLAHGGDPTPARRLLGFFTSARASRRFRQCGFQPITSR